MPLLQVRDIPEDLYDKLSQIAKKENRSIAQETIVLLRTALNLKEERKIIRQKIITEMEALNTDEKGSLPDPAELLREDRDR